MSRLSEAIVSTRVLVLEDQGYETAEDYQRAGAIIASSVGNAGWMVKLLRCSAEGF